MSQPPEWAEIGRMLGLFAGLVGIGLSIFGGLVYITELAENSNSRPSMMQMIFEDRKDKRRLEDLRDQRRAEERQRPDPAHLVRFSDADIIRLADDLAQEWARRFQ